jgi:hypothetical protein
MYHSNIEHLLLLLFFLNASIVNGFPINYLKPEYLVYKCRFLLAQITNNRLAVKLQINYRINYTNTLKIGKTRLTTLYFQQMALSSKIHKINHTLLRK